jgi:hypothetical protein
MNAIATTLIAIAAGAVLTLGALRERRRTRLWRGPRPTGDPVRDYERTRRELDGRLARLRENGL